MGHPWGLHSQQGIDYKGDERDRERERERVYKLHSMVNQNNLQQVGLVSSRQQRKVHR